jgi:hypothetical protein
MKSESDIKRDAEDELKWDGVATLVGCILIRTTHSARHDFPRRWRSR